MLTWLVPAVIKSVKIEETHSQMKDAVVFIPHCLALQILAEKELPPVELPRPSDVPRSLLQVSPPLLESAVFTQTDRKVRALTVWRMCYFAGVQKHKASSRREGKPRRKCVRFADRLPEHQKNWWDDVHWRAVVMCVVLYYFLLHKYSLISQMAYGE